MTDQHEPVDTHADHSTPSQPARPATGLMAVRDVADEMLPGGYLPWLMAAIIIIVVLAVMFSVGHP